MYLGLASSSASHVCQIISTEVRQIISKTTQMSTELVIAELQGREVPPEASSVAELTPAQFQLRRMVLDSVTSVHSRRNYAKALDLLFAFAGSRPLSRALLLEFRATMDGLAPSTVNVRLSAIHKLVSEAHKNGVLSAEDAANLTDIPTSGRREPIWGTG